MRTRRPLDPTHAPAARPPHPDKRLTHPGTGRPLSSGPVPRASAVERLFLLLPALLLLTCLNGGCRRVEEKTGSSGGGTTATTDSATGAGEAKPADSSFPPPTLVELEPVLREAAAPGIMPRNIELSVALPSINRGLTLDPQSFRIEPPVEGRLEVADDTTLRFSPSCQYCFDPATKYTVTLSSLPTIWGKLEGAPVTRTFTTPKFALIDLEYADVRPGAWVQVDLVFSAPVDAGQLPTHVKWQLDGAPLTRVSYSPGHGWDGNRVRATLYAAEVKASSTVEYAQDAGVPLLRNSEVTAPATKRTLKLDPTPEATVHAVEPQEGLNGYYLEVRCTDATPRIEKPTPAAYQGDAATSSDEEAGEAESEGESDEESSDDDSKETRYCMFDEAEAARAIKFDPPVKFSIARATQGFRIYGDFARGPYSIRIDPGIRSKEGGLLKKPVSRSIRFQARKPQLGFVAQGRYLPRDAWKSLAIRHMNLREVNLSIRHIPVENLVFWMGDESEAATERVSDLVFQKSLPLSGKANVFSVSWVDVSLFLPQTPRGVLELSLTAAGQEAKARLLLTDLNLVAKRTAEGDVWVWALDMRTNRALSGVDVRQVVKSGRVVGRCTTDLSGGCMIPDSSVADLEESERLALIATYGNDLTYLRFQDLRTEISETTVAGEPYNAEQAYRTAVYSDRGVYRPGDTAHITAILRDRDNLAPPEGMPVLVRLIDPKQQVARRVMVKTPASGMVSVDFPFAAFADTGSWRVIVASGDNDIGEYAFNVEEFVPERMKVGAKTPQPAYLTTDAVPIEVEARYLFGGSAAGSPVEVACEIAPSSFKPTQNAHFEYGIVPTDAADDQSLPLGSVTGELGETGSATLPCPTSRRAGGFVGPAELRAKVSVLEAGSGRATVGSARVPVHPEKYYLGLLAGSKKVKPGQPFSVQGIVVDWNGKPVDSVSSVAVELLRIDSEYRWGYDEEVGEWTYVRDQRPVSEGSIQSPVAGGKFQVTLTADQSADRYLVRVRAGKARTDLAIDGEHTFWWTPLESRSDNTPRPAKAAWLELTVPDQLRVAETANVSVNAPFRGRILFTAETDALVTYTWMDVEAGKVDWSFVPPRFAPNLYISAFLVKDPSAEAPTAFVPDRAFGVKSVKVEPVQFTRKMSIDAPKEVRSNSRLNVKLDLGPLDEPTTVTVAAVDEGILSLTRFKTPNPFESIFTRRALGVETFETIGWALLLPPRGPSSATGGDEDGGDGGRVQPVKPVALWSGVLDVPKDGKINVPFDVPQYRGALRVMAVAAGKQRMARAEAEVLVRDPIVVQATVPRFLTRSDEVQIPVFLTNVSGKPRQIDVTVAARPLPVPGLETPAGLKDPEVIALSKGAQSITLKDGASGTLVFQARALLQIGAAKVIVEAKSAGEVFKEEIDVPFLSAAPKTRLVRRIELQDGKTDLLAYLKGWVPTTEKTSIWVTNNPYADAFDHLSHLVHYPYGCIEQTTSSTRPLLYVSNLLRQVDPGLLADSSIEAMVMSGVNRALSMQTPSGGFAYWPGGGEPVDWGTAYATHMLLDASKLNYPVPRERVDQAIEYIERRLSTHYETRAGGQPDAWYYYDEEPYLQYVAALAGKGRKARIQKLLDERQKRPAAEIAEQRYLLEAALYLSGDHRYEADLKKPDLSALTDTRANTWTFYSDRRRRGLMLSTFVELFGNQPAGEALADLVADGLRGHSSGWYTTQELVWGVTGLGKWIGDKGSSSFSATLVANGRELRPQSTDPKAAAAGNAGTAGSKAGQTPGVLNLPGASGKAKEAPQINDRSWALRRASERQQLELSLVRRDAGKVYAIVSSEGMREDAAYTLGGNGLKVERRYFDGQGTPVNPGSGALTLGDVIYTEVTLTNTGLEDIQNIALVDRFPSGWEVENPRLGRDRRVEWIDADSLWAADYMNIRDDRIEVFGRLQRKESRKVFYAVRAVSAGRFTLPPVEAEAMYDPRLWARGPGGTVLVAGPWGRLVD